MISDKEAQNLNDYLNNNNIQLVENKEFMYPCTFALILCCIIYYSAYENNNYTCNNIIVNTYLYVLLSLVLFHIFTLIFVKFKSIKYLSLFIKKTGLIVYFIVLLGLLLGIFYIFDTLHINIFGSHLVLLLLIMIFSYFFSYMYILLNLQGLYQQVIITTCLTVFALLSLFYFKKNEMIEYISNNNNYTIFVVVFMIVVLFQLVYYFLFGYSKIVRIIVASVVILCFMFLLITDTQKILQITPENCKKALKMCKDDITNAGCVIDNYPSYPQKSFDIFHDIIILARNIAQIYLATNND